MNKINIPFKGMSNVQDDSYSQDGIMSVLLNMRHKGGELVQCQPPTERPASKVMQAMFHAQSRQWLELTTDGIVQYTDGAGGASFPVAGVKSFAIMGNIVIMYLESSVEYAIWRNGGYVYLGELPEVPRLLASNLQEQTKKRQTEEEYYTRYVADKKSLYNRAVQKGFIDEILNSIYEECGYVDRAWFRVGLKLFDGSYIALSGIYQLSARRAGENDLIGVQINDMWYPSTNTGGDNEHYTARVGYFVPNINVTRISENWKDVISSIDVFSTGSIMSYVAAKERGERDGALLTDQYEWYRKRTAEELKDAMINAEFYKVAEYSLKGEKLWGIENTSPSNLAVQQQLKDVQVHSVIPGKTFVLNSRLHAAGADEVYFKGYAPAYKYDSSNNARSENHWTVVVYINTDNGQRKVVYTESEGSKPDLLYYFMYPDSRATKMEIYRTMDGRLEVLELPLTAHRVRNEAYFLRTILASVTIQGTAEGENKTYSSIPVIDTGLNWEDAEEIPEADNMDVFSNILKVSAVDNPFYFPTAQTYKFEGNIVALASNAEAISTGQFGQYPLFVFTTEGIWAMAVDASGQGAYTSQSPFSREVCSGAVCPVSGGIVFTTERGVMAISGGQVTELSQPLDGLENLMLAETQLFDSVFYKAGKQVVSPQQIREYLKPVEGYETKLAYNYLHNEVILSNAMRDYSYVYSLTNQEWSIIDVLFDVTTNSYPELVVYNNIEQNRYEFTEGNDKVPIVAITRPVKVDTLDFKRLRQAALRCTFEGCLNFYVLGSNDGASFVCITGKECPTKSEVDSGVTSVSTRRDLITSMSRSKQYKYIAIAVAGIMKGRISLAEMLVEGGFASNQLR